MAAPAAGGGSGRGQRQRHQRQRTVTMEVAGYGDGGVRVRRHRVPRGWCLGGSDFASRAERMKVEILEWSIKAPLPCFLISRIFVPQLMFPSFPFVLVPQLDPLFRYTISPSTISLLLVFDGLTVFCQRGTKIQAMPVSDLLRLSYLGGSSKHSNDNFED